MIISGLLYVILGCMNNVFNSILIEKYKTLEIEKRVTDIYSNIYDNIIDQEIKNKPIYIKNNLSK